MSNNSQFLSVPNLKKNLQVLQTYMLKEKQININELNIDLNKPIFEIMKQTYDKNKGKSVHELNLLTITSLRNNILTMIQNSKKEQYQNKPQNQMMNPNQNAGLISGVNNPPQMTFREDNKNITSKLYEQRNSMYNEQNKPRMPMFDNNAFISQQSQNVPNQKQLPPTINANGDNSDMMAKLNEMQKNRENLENEIVQNPQQQTIENFQSMPVNISNNISGNEIKNESDKNAQNYSNNPQTIPKQPLKINANPLQPQAQLTTSQPMIQKHNINLTPQEHHKALMSKDSGENKLNNLVKNSNELNKNIPPIINQQFNEQPFIENKKDNHALSENQTLKPSPETLYNQQQMNQMFEMIPQIIRQQLQEITKEHGEIKTANNDFIKEKRDEETKNNVKKQEIVGVTNKDNEMQSKSYNNYINSDGKLIDSILANIHNLSSNGSSTTYDPRIDLSLQSFKLLNDANFNYVTYSRSILINSGDRNTTNYKKRCNFRISVNSSASDTIQTSLKNIKSISIGSIVIPMPFNTKAAYDYLNNQNLNYYITNYYHHYLGLFIDNMEGEYDGTNSNISKNISNLVVDKTIYNQDGRNFIIFKPIQNDKKIFKTPLSSLTSMHIKLLTPNGVLINEYKDNTIEIQSIDLVSSNYLFKFTTVTRFTHNDLFRNDTIKFSGFNITTDDTTGVGAVDANKLVQLNNFLNRSDGHKVHNLGPGALNENDAQTDTDEYNDIYIYTYNQFYIQTESSLTFTDQLAYINASSLTGTFINLTAQNVISIQAEYLEMENDNQKTGLV